MVTMTKMICGVPPRMRIVTKYECDLCGCSCNQDGTQKERLYKYNNDFLCYECLWDALINDGIVETVE